MSKAVITIVDVDDEHISVQVEFDPALSSDYDTVPLAHLMAMNALDAIHAIHAEPDEDAVMEA